MKHKNNIYVKLKGSISSVLLVVMVTFVSVRSRGWADVSFGEHGPMGRGQNHTSCVREERAINETHTHTSASYIIINHSHTINHNSVVMYLIKVTYFRGY